MDYKNKIRFQGFYGSDRVICQSAWTSTDREITPEKEIRIPNLIKMLWEEGHETPFEKVNVHFLVDTEIASHIHLLKHRISSANAESGRYKELMEDKFYLPEDWKGIGMIGINGGIMDWYEVLKETSEYNNKLYHACLKDLTPVLGRKRAKESARFFKMYNSQIETDIQFNLRSFANFMKLRNSEKAQKEIREIAQEMWRTLEIETKGQIKYAMREIEKRIKFEEKCIKNRELIMSLPD